VRRVTFRLAGEPRGKGRPQFSVRAKGAAGRPIVNARTPAKTRHYEAALAMAAQQAMVSLPLLEGPLRVLMIAVFAIPASWPARKRELALKGHVRPTKKPDWDNCAKMTDALQGIVFGDDAYIVDGRLLKWFGPKPELEVTVEELDALPSQASSPDFQRLLKLHGS